MLCVLVSSTASAQGTTADTRPGSNTIFGDTGLWFVPTAEILPHKKVSVSGYRANWDYRQGLTDVSHFAITGAAGLRDRVEIFGSFRADTRIDHDRAPIFGPTDPVFGGLVNDYPYVRTGWSGDNVGDLLIGAGVLTPAQVDHVARAQRASGARFGETARVVVVGQRV